MKPGLAISTTDLGKRYRLGRLKQETLSEVLAHPSRAVGHLLSRSSHPHVWALNRVSLDVSDGEAVGIIGRNGAGKSTLLKILARITRPTTGHATIAGMVGSLLEVGTGFHPELTGRENVYLNGAILGMSKAYIDRRFDEIVEFAETDRFIDTPVKRYSTGMQMRLAFAVAAYLEPHVLLVDEVLAVGDAQFQKKCLGRMSEVANEGRTILFVSHNMGSIVRLCDRAVWIDEGSVKEDGDAREVVRKYLEVGVPKSQSMSWARGEGPGDESLRLRSLQLRQSGKVSTVLEIDKPFEIVIETDVAQDISREIAIAVQISSVEGEVLLHSSEALEEDLVMRSRGRWRTTCSIPAFAFNEGTYYLSIGADEPHARMVIAFENAMSFTVQGASPGMGRYGPGAWKGLLGPGLARWSVTPIE